MIAINKKENSDKREMSFSARGVNTSRKSAFEKDTGKEEKGRCELGACVIRPHNTAQIGRLYQMNVNPKRAGVTGGSQKPRSTVRSPPQVEARGSRGSRHLARKGATADKRRTVPTSNQTRWRRKRVTQSDDTIFDWKVYDKKFWNQYWLRFSGTVHPGKMPLSGSTRMLRARRKDINIKPNRRLDRKSSKGMLFENEELRMRTIAINSEVEQGQQALKKLKRENELLRREVWSLRDEYSKMESTHNKKESDGEESDQENSYSDDESHESDEEAYQEEDQASDPPTENQENVENQQKSTWLTPRRSSRGFDGLSVIDEQTEETQTTDGYGNSRSSSVARPFLPEPDTNLYPVYTFLDPRMYGSKTQRKKNMFDNGFEPEWNLMGFRPPSPYPYAKANPIPSYEHRLHNIQEPHIPHFPGNNSCTDHWLYPDRTGPDDRNGWIGATPINIPAGYPLGIVQERHGPDVFITDTFTYLQPANVGPAIDLMGVASDLNKIEISQKSESSPKYTMGTHGALSEPSAIQEAPSAFVSSTLDPPALNAEPEGGDAESSLVGCQFASTEDARQIADPEDADMRRVPHEKPKPFQSKLTLTLRNPETGRKSPSRPSTPQPSTSNRVATTTLKHQQPRLQTFAPQPSTSSGNLLNGDRHSIAAADIPNESKTLPRVLGSSTSLDGLTVPKINKMARKIPPTPPPRTSSCPAVSAVAVTAPTVGVTALHHRAFRKGKSTSMSSQHESDREQHHQTTDSAPSQYSSTNPLLLSEPVATSSPTLQPKFSGQKPMEKPKLRKQNSIRSVCQEETTDDTAASQLMRKPSKSSKADSERSATRKLRKQSQISLTSLDPNLNNPLCDRTRFLGLNNVSISSSSGLDSPTKSDRRKRRVSIKFNKRTSSFDEDRPGILTNFRSKSRCDETDATTSDRERTNSISSRTSSLTRRKLSTSSSRTIFQEEKIPWCGCWGNGCV